jgi:PIN domain nuclease of toxin-antitoxin system
MPKVLLDTHTFIWWDSNPSKLSQPALDYCQNPRNVLLLSVASLWEMQIKLQLGKLKLNHPLSIKPTHVLALDGLPPYHKDPFDRMLVAQALIEGAILLSGDQNIHNYGQIIPVVW